MAGDGFGDDSISGYSLFYSERITLCGVAVSSIAHDGLSHDAEHKVDWTQN